MMHFVALDLENPDDPLDVFADDADEAAALALEVLGLPLYRLGLIDGGGLFDYGL